MTRLQRMRLSLETSIRMPIVTFSLILLVVMGFILNSELLAVGSVALLILTLGVVLAVSQLTDHWWYNEYPDNRWGLYRQSVELDKIISVNSTRRHKELMATLEELDKIITQKMEKKDD